MGAIVVWARVVLLGPTGAEVASWVIGGPGGPDLRVVDALARASLAARRHGGSIRLRHVAKELGELVDLADLRREVGWEPEGGEHEIGVEEGVEPADPAA